MYKTPEDHITAIISWFSKAFTAKYSAGQIEHTGRLWKKNTQDMLEEEALDFISYVFTRREQVNDATKILERALFIDSTCTRDDVLKAYYLLQYGNAEGTLERDK